MHAFSPTPAFSTSCQSSTGAAHSGTLHRYTRKTEIARSVEWFSHFSSQHCSKMAGVRGLAILAVVVLACIADAPGLAVANLYDGRPRPPGFPDTPTVAYGPTPPCLVDGVDVTCQWYGFAHIGFPEAVGLECLNITRQVLANITITQPGYLTPYTYWYLKSMIFDTTNNDTYCNYGCFDMSASGPVGSPPLVFAPPPATIATPPPALIAPPPPSTLVAPPPPSTLVAPPPSSTLSTPPPGPLAPTTTPAVPPPPPSNTRVINLNGAGFLQPTGVVSFIISGALLILHGLLGF